MKRGLRMCEVEEAYHWLIAGDDGVKISPGNEKLSKIPNMSLIPGETCPGEVDECKFCYAKSILKVFAHTKVRWMVNTFYARSDLDRFIKDVVAQVYLKHCKYFRIHVGGDFFSQEYLNAWYDICKQLPDVQFLAFTKSFMFDYSNKPENLGIMWSVFPSTDNLVIPPGPRAYTSFEDLDIPYGGPTEERHRYMMAMECSGTCEACGFCFNIDRNSTRLSLAGGPQFMDVGFHAHGRAVTLERKRVAAQNTGGSEDEEQAG